MLWGVPVDGAWSPVSNAENRRSLSVFEAEIGPFEVWAQKPEMRARRTGNGLARTCVVRNFRTAWPIVLKFGENVEEGEACYCCEFRPDPMSRFRTRAPGRN